MIVLHPDKIRVFDFLLDHREEISDRVILCEQKGVSIEAVFIVGIPVALFSTAYHYDSSEKLVDNSFYFHAATINYPPYRNDEDYRGITIGQELAAQTRAAPKIFRQLNPLISEEASEILEAIRVVEPVLADLLLFHLDRLF